MLEEEKLAGVPILVYANKQDLNSAASAAELSISMGLQQLRDRSWEIQPCSAMTGEGLQVIS